MKPGSTIGSVPASTACSVAESPRTRTMRPSRSSSVPRTNPSGVRMEPAISETIRGLRPTQALADEMQRAVERIAGGLDEPRLDSGCEPRLEPLADTSGDDQRQRRCRIERKRDLFDRAGRRFEQRSGPGVGVLAG